MVRKIAAFLVVLALLTALVFGYLHITETKPQQKDPFLLVPIHSPVIFSINEPAELFSSVSNNNLIWNEMKSYTEVNELDSFLQSIDSSFTKLVKQKYLASEKLLVSLVESGSGRYAPLFIFQLQMQAEAEELQAKLSELFPAFKPTLKTYDDENYFELIDEQKTMFSRLYLFEKEGLLALCTSELVIEDVIRQSSSDLNLLLDESLQRIRATSNPKNDANVYLNPATLEPLASLAIQNRFVKSADAFSLWSELDLSIKPNALRFNGFMHLPDSLAYFAACFQEQATASFSCRDFIPTDAAWFYGIGINDFARYQKNYNAYLKSINSAFQYEKDLKTLQDSLGENEIDDYLKLIDGEIGVFVRESFGQPEEDKLFGIFKLTQLERLELLTRTEDLENETIYAWSEPSFFSTYFRGPFSQLTPSYFMLLDDDYVLLANTEFALRDYLGNYYSNRVWGKDISFEKLENNLSSKSNLFFYFSPRHGVDALKKYGSEEVAIFAETQTDRVKTIASSSFQLTYESGDLYYANALVEYDPNVESSSTSLWEIQLDTGIHAGPFLFTNHYTGAKEILVQDSLSQLYLISNTGKVLWKEKLDGLMYPKYYQVDRYKNGKYQLLLNTENSVYLIDRKGRNVEGFPVSVSQGISYSLSLMDYDNDLDYRLLIPTKNGQLLNYSIEGKEVSGWKFEKAESPIESEVYHYAIKRKDYLLCKTEKGKLRAVARNGKDRLKIESSFKGVGGIQFFEAATLDESFVSGIDLDSNLVVLYLNDKVERKQFDSPLKNYLLKRGESGKAEFIYVFKDHVESAENNLVQFMYVLPSSLQYSPALVINEGEPTLFYDDKTAGQIRFLKLETNRANAYPFEGFGPFVIGDINQDEVQDLVVVDKPKTVKVFSL